jgi:hypothetical protein
MAATGALNRFLTDLFERPSELLPPPDVAIDSFALPVDAALVLAVEPRAIRHDDDDVTFFVMRVELSRGIDQAASRAILLRRFSDFVALRDALRANFPSSAIAPLPAKTFLGSVTDAIVAERAAALDRWSRDIAKQFFSHALVQAFFAFAAPRSGDEHDDSAAIVAAEAELRAEFAALADVAELRARCNAFVVRECLADDSGAAVRHANAPYRALALAERSLWCKELQVRQLHASARSALTKQLQRRSRDPPVDNQAQRSESEL